MAADGYRVETDNLRAGGRRLHHLSDDLRDSTREPLAPPAGNNGAFASFQAAVAAAEAWEGEAGELAAVLSAAGDTLRDTAAGYDRAEDSAVISLQRITHGG